MWNRWLYRCYYLVTLYILFSSQNVIRKQTRTLAPHGFDCFNGYNEAQWTVTWSAGSILRIHNFWPHKSTVFTSAAKDKQKFKDNFLKSKQSWKTIENWNWQFLFLLTGGLIIDQGLNLVVYIFCFLFKSFLKSIKSENENHWSLKCYGPQEQ